MRVGVMMELLPITTRTAGTYQVTIYIAGSTSEAVSACRRWAMRGACVTVTPCDYVYTFGAETGVAVGLMNYPRFPKLPAEIDRMALGLARYLIEELCQGSASVVTPAQTYWLTRRGDA